MSFLFVRRSLPIKYRSYLIPIKTYCTVSRNSPVSSFLKRTSCTSCLSASHDWHGPFHCNHLIQHDSSVFRTMINPSILVSAGVRVTRALHTPGVLLWWWWLQSASARSWIVVPSGTFIVTFPQAYHAGFSVGCVACVTARGGCILFFYGATCNM